MMDKAMHCHQARALLATRTSEQAPQDDDPRLKDHLAICPACARLASDYQRDRARLGGFLDTASWSPVAQRPWQEAPTTPARRAAWGRLATGANWLAGLGLAAVVALTLALVLPVMARGGGGAGTGSAPPLAPTPTVVPAACTVMPISRAPWGFVPTAPPEGVAPVADAGPLVAPGATATPAPMAGTDQTTTACPAAPPCGAAAVPAQGATTPTPTPAYTTAAPDSPAPGAPSTVSVTGGGVCVTAIPWMPSLPAVTPTPHDPAMPTPSIVPAQSGPPTPTPAR